MKSLNSTIRIALAFAAGAGLAALDRNAHADFSGSYSSATQYNFKFTHMPDFDQKRGFSQGIVGLPGEGNMYCVPVATMNLFAYAANHGFPNVGPGPAWWQSNQLYNQAGNQIITLGALMGTHPADGTNSSNAQIGALIWLANSNLTCSTFIAAGNWAPTVTHISEAVMNGGIVAFGYGRYVYLGDIGGGMHVVGMRTGGHRVTLVQAARSGDQIVIKVRDPGDDPDINTDINWLYNQSPFTNKVFGTVQQVNALSSIDFTSRFSTSLIMPPPVNSSGVPIMRLITSVIVVVPKWGLTWQPGINNNPPKIKFKMPQYNGSFINPDVLIDLLDLNHVNDVAPGLDFGTAFVVGDDVGGIAHVKKVNLTTGEVREVGSLTRATDIVFGRKRELYALSVEQLWCLNVDDEEREDPIEASVFPPGPCAAMCYDDARDEIILLCPSQHKIFRYQHRLPAGAAPHVQCIPENIVMAGDGSVHVNPVDGKVWFCTEGANVIYHVPDDPNCNPVVEQISFSEIIAPKSISFDDAGKMFVKCDAGLKKLVYNDRLDRWEIVADDDFAGFDVGPKFYISRSRTNYDPAIHDGPEWQNVDPEEERNLEGTHLEIDCLADLVTSATFQPPPDGVVDAADLAFLLGAWGDAMDSSADIVTSTTFTPPEDGTVDAADLAFLLGAWGPCPMPN